METDILFRPVDLGLILSYKCQSNCGHCLYNCGRDWNDWISETDIEGALTATQSWEHLYQVHITGGEPFLNFPLLKHAVQVCDQLGIPVYVETNGGWCTSDDLAIRRFAELKKAGLQAVLVSCSPFHAEHIQPARMLRAIEHAQAVFSANRVIVYLENWLSTVVNFGTNKTTPLDKYIEAYGENTAGKMFWNGYGLISGGRCGYRLGGLTQRYPAEHFEGENCRSELLYAPHSHFDLYGNFIPGFCGGLAFGSWKNLSALEKSFRSGQIPRIIQILIEKGPFGLADTAFNYGYTQFLDGYAGKCHLCVDLRAHLSTSNQYPELAPTLFYSDPSIRNSNKSL